MQPSPLYRELDQAIRQRAGRPLAELVTVQRTAGKGWRAIARILTTASGGIPVSHETVRAWFGDQFVIAPRDPDPTDRVPGG